VSLTTPGALEVVAELAAAGGDAVLGVGTVLDETSARLASLAGASFIVTPTLDPRVIATAHRYGLSAVPGVSTPSEAVAALDAGADAVKLFPAVALGVTGLAAIREALPQVPFVPTGGVRIEDAEKWLDAGAVALGMGGALSRLAADAAAQAAEFLRRLRLPA
jgi:2-dehydro-3-deoxyphosphogluconate aldolase/(4S)-4-hydroxy-2-oxoglutarate aldolase